MNNTAVANVLNIIKPMSKEAKLTILSAVSEDLGLEFDTKSEILDKLFEGWNSDPILSSDELEKDIYNSRTISEKEINFDD